MKRVILLIPRTLIWFPHRDRDGSCAIEKPLARSLVILPGGDESRKAVMKEVLVNLDRIVRHLEVRM